MVEVGRGGGHFTHKESKINPVITSTAATTTTTTTTTTNITIDLAEMKGFSSIK